MANLVCEPLRSGKAERSQALAAYSAYLRDHDGDVTEDGNRLTKREEAMARLSSQRVRYDGPVQADLFRVQYEKFSPSRETPRELLLLLAFTKVNSHEAFAVETLTRIRKKVPAAEKRIIQQEQYHTRLLLSAAELFGLQVQGAAAPPKVLKVLVQGVARTPPFIMHPLAMAGEVYGIATFRRLLEATRRTLAHRPELRDALEERVMAVFTDELGHLSYNRLRLGRWGMAAVRAMLPGMLKGFRNHLPELDLLSGGPMTPAELELSFDDMPAAARNRAFIA